MNAVRRLQKNARLLVCGSALLVMQPDVHSATEGEITAVSSRVSEDYIRSKLADGSFQPEAFAFGEGGHLPGAAHDDTIDKLKFSDVARTIAGPLTGQKYLPALDPNHTKLLIMVYWGTTIGSSDDPNFPPARTAEEKLMFKSQRDQDDVRNARLLGYDSAGVIGTDYGRRLLISGALRYKADDLLEEIGDNRYFVVLMAYDFQLLWKEKKHKLLWETRFSVREHRNDFGQVLPAMAQYASKYFGQDSHGLLRKPLPEGHVTLGKLEVGEVVPEK